MKVKIELDTDELIEALKAGASPPTAPALNLKDHGDRMYLMGKCHAAQTIAGRLASLLLSGTPAFEACYSAAEGRPWEQERRAQRA